MLFDCCLGCAVTFFNDLVEFDQLTMSWTDLSSQIRGTHPSERYNHGFTSADGVLYLFGGLNDGGRNTGTCGISTLSSILLNSHHE